MDQKWFGFEKGCDCRIHNESDTVAKTRKDLGLHRKPCTYVQRAIGCIELDGTDYKPLKVWKGKVICKKPLPPKYTWFDIILPANYNHTCPEG